MAPIKLLTPRAMPKVDRAPTPTPSAPKPALSKSPDAFAPAPRPGPAAHLLFTNAPVQSPAGQHLQTLKAGQVAAFAGARTDSKPLDAFFTAHLKARTPAASGLKELLAAGSLSPAASATLANQGVSPSDLKEVAAELEPHFPELGLVGEAMARAITDVLGAAGQLAQLAPGALAGGILGQTLPLRLAEGLTRGQPLGVSEAAKEFLGTGFISPRAFEALGAEGLGQLALSLEAGRSQLETLLGDAGRSLLASGAAALGKAALEQVGTFAELAGAFLSNVPAGERTFWEGQVSGQARAGSGKLGDALPGERALAQQRAVDGHVGAKGGVKAGADGLAASGQAGVAGRAQSGVKGSVAKELGGGVSARARGQANASGEAFAGAEGQVTVGPTGVDAAGRAGAGVRGHVDASGSASVDTGLSHHSVSGQAQASGEAFIGAEGQAHAGADGVSVNARVGGAAEAQASAEVDLSHELFGGAVGADTHVEGSVSARAAAQVTVEGNVGFDEEGDVEAYVGVTAEAIAVVEAEAEASQSINIFGFKIVLGGYARASAGVGGEAHAGAGYKDGKFFALGGAGAAAEAGGRLAGFASIELPPWAQGVMNLLAKTESGRAAIGAVGSSVNPLISTLGGLVDSGSSGKAQPA